jgi:hypothetical protein
LLKFTQNYKINDRVKNKMIILSSWTCLESFIMIINKIFLLLLCGILAKDPEINSGWHKLKAYCLSYFNEIFQTNKEYFIKWSF